jgi:hypothetical protein
VEAPSSVDANLLNNFDAPPETENDREVQ